VLNSGGGGSDSNIIAGIEHCADPGLPGGPGDVMNLSIGVGQYSSTCDTHSWALAANNAAAAGVVVVAASGNAGYSNSMASPACGSDVIAVGATYKDDYPNCEDSQSSFDWCLDFLCLSTCTDNMPAADDLVCFSNASNMLDVAAPGSVILSASTSAGGSSITGMSGTSQASPHVAGLAALILDADGGLSPAQVRQIIRDGAIDMGPAGFDPEYGYGRVDVINSLSLVTPCSVNADCDDGLFCKGAEVCNAGTCEAGSDPCPGQDCDEAGDVCVPLVCNADGTCDPGEDCNNCASDCISGAGASCGNGICEPGEDCISCAGDCRGKTGGKPSTRYCCSGTPGGGGGTNPVDCNDGRCTQDVWECSFSADSYCCGDATCEGAEDEANCAVDCAVTCSGPGDCADGVTCTDDACVDSSCVNTPNDANCPDDGLFCNGTEFCDPVTDCDSTGDPCGVNETCNETTDVCDPITCALKGEACTVNEECCSNNCRRSGKCG
jgi:hypothetical protein